jgi:hypothetical protein
MARYVLVEVDDLATAERLRAQIDKASIAGKPMRIAGLFAAPTSWCSCPKSEGYHKNEVVRGSKLGWWVHRVCRKARPGTHNLANLITVTDRDFGVESGRVHVVHTLQVAEVPRQNLR